ncbi:chitin deacetylase [Tulasnella sp. 418]|nr:chitin deacetylase [Tulasnella sp. 418]
MKTTQIASVAFLASTALACADHEPRYYNPVKGVKKRQAVETVDGNIIPPISALTSGYPTQATSALASLPTAGTVSPIVGAPALPDISTFDPTKYPAFRAVPPTDSPEVKEWMKELEGHVIPSYAPNVSPVCSENPEALADTSRCWWTCHRCSGPGDVETCPAKMTWGLTFDDGPSPETPKLLNYLNKKGQKATFYLIGSNVMAHPEMVQAEYISGHELSIHSWSHTPLTTLTNEQIVAELGWTRKVIKDVTGLSPATMRPPQGDMDSRVRAISLAMGLTPVLWTEDATGSFDTFDWHISAGMTTGQQAWDDFQKILATAESRQNGFITLQHDLHPETVNFALHTVPWAIDSGKFKVTTVIDCLGKPLSEAYIETKTGGASNNSTGGGGVPASITGSATGSRTASGSARPSGTGSTQQSTSGASSIGVTWTMVGALVAGVSVLMASL